MSHPDSEIKITWDEGDPLRFVLDFGEFRASLDAKAARAEKRALGLSVKLTYPIPHLEIDMYAPINGDELLGNKF